MCLVAAIVSLLGTRTSLLDTAGIGGSGSARGASTWCAPRGLPPLASTDRGDLLQLRDGLLRVFAVTRGRGYSGGVIAPEDMWSDNSPLGPRASRLADGRWPAGYEVRWWTRYYDLVADVLVLRTPHRALAFFEQVASSDCHRDGAQQPAPWPPRAHNLAWLNPDHAPQNDVFLLRGRRVYRVAAVRLDDAPKETARVQRRIGAKLVDALACVLPGADCATGGAVGVDYSHGYLQPRSWRLTWSGPLLGDQTTSKGTPSPPSSPAAYVDHGSITSNPSPSKWRTLRVATLALRAVAMPAICRSRISKVRPARCRLAAIVPAAIAAV